MREHDVHRRHSTRRHGRVLPSADDTNGQAATVELKIKRDATPPVVTGGAPARAADVDGWYNRAVGLTFAGSDLTSGIDSCTSTTYGGPDSATASVAGTCVDKAGNVSAPLSYGLKYDATAPSVVRVRARAAGERERLVQPGRPLRHRRQRRDVGHRRLPAGHLQRP